MLFNHSPNKTFMKAQSFIGSTLILIGMLLIAFGIISMQVKTADSAAFTGSVAFITSATTTTVGPQAVPAVTLFQAREAGSNCKARVVSTSGNSAIMISFGDVTGFGSTTVSGTAGHWQAASTTVAYDSGLFGCGRWTAFGYASTTVMVTEF